MSSLCQRTPAPRSVPDISEFLRISSRDLARVLLSRRDLRALGIQVANVTLLAWEAAGKFPKRLHLGPGTVAWLASELEDYFASLAATRD
jgi:prophage regulatory protein